MVLVNRHLCVANRASWEIVVDSGQSVRAPLPLAFLRSSDSVISSARSLARTAYVCVAEFVSSSWSTIWLCQVAIPCEMVAARKSGVLIRAEKLS